MTESDKLFEYIGGFGAYQLFVFVIVTTMGIMGMESMGINFIAGEMDHWCEVEGLTELPHSQQQYVAIPYDPDAGSDDFQYENCEHWDENYTVYSPEELMAWNRTVAGGGTVADCESWVYDQSEYYSTITCQWDLVCGKTWTISLISSFWMLGYLIGTISVGATSDAIGRKNCLFIFFIIKLVGCFVSAFAPGYWTFVLGRFLIGLGGVCFLAAYILMMECVADYYRSIMGSMFYFFCVTGYVILVWQAYVIREEVKFQLAWTIPQILILLFYFYLPESPRWLLVKEKYKDAEKVIRYIAAVNKIELPDDLDTANIVQKRDDEIPKGTCLDLMRSPRLRVRTIIICLHWFTDSLMWYAVSLNTGKLPGDIYANTLLLGLVELPANLIVLFFLNWKITGRRWTCGGALIIAGIINFCCIPAILNDQGTTLTTLSIIGKGFVTAAFTGIYVYTTEIFPTEIRNIAMGSASLFARISGMIAPFIGGPLYDVWGPLPNIIFGTFGLFTGIVALWLPETLGHKMMETVEEAEAFTGKKNTSSSVYLDSTVEVAAKPGTDLVGYKKYDADTNDVEKSDVQNGQIGMEDMDNAGGYDNVAMSKEEV